MLLRYIIRTIIIKKKCTSCIQSLITDLKSTHLAADLVNIKTKGFLVHSQHNLFKILETLDLCLMKHSEKANPFPTHMKNFFSKKNLHLLFSCALHKTEMFIDIFVIYITMRMRQHSHARNNVHWVGAKCIEG